MEKRLRRLNPINVAIVRQVLKTGIGSEWSTGFIIQGVFPFYGVCLMPSVSGVFWGGGCNIHQRGYSDEVVRVIRQAGYEVERKTAVWWGFYNSNGMKMVKSFMVVI